MTERREVASIRVAVVGHANAGKTSLLRTLTRDTDFGEVSDSPGTTTEVIPCTLHMAGSPAVELLDTPGLEDSIALLESLEASRADHQTDGLDLITQFMDSPAAHARFAREAKALRAVLACDATLYVIDARDRVLARYRDELRVLGYCAKPIVPVLNFVQSARAQTAAWRDQLARVNMHAVAEFDTVALDTYAELQLFEKMQTLLDEHRHTFQDLITHRRGERANLVSTSARSVADMLIDVAACSIEVDAGKQNVTDEAAMLQLRQLVRDREQSCITELLEVHRFRADDCIASELPLADGTWGIDLFSSEALHEYGVRGTGGAAAGAMVGLTLDVLLHGLSLGAGTAMGAALGAAAGAGRLPGKNLWDRLRGHSRLRVDSSTLQLLAIRQSDLVVALFHRGHAGKRPLLVGEGDRTKGATTEINELMKSIRPAFSRADWSRIVPVGTEAATPAPSLARQRLHETLTDQLRKLLTPRVGL